MSDLRLRDQLLKITAWCLFRLSAWWKTGKSLKTHLNPTGKTENMYLHSLTCGCVMN